MSRLNAVSCCLLAVVVAVSVPLHAQTSGSLHTRQTAVVLEADRHAPRLLKVQPQGAPAWQNSASEELVSSVEIDGKAVPVTWALDEKASRITEQTIDFVYTSAEPKLRLTWRWTARAEFGPVEHSIAIENLDSRGMWLPMQDSFAFRFATAADDHLTHIYIDKGMGKPSDVGTHTVPVSAGYAWEGRSSTYARDSDEREIIPISMVERDTPAHDGWYVGIEFSGRTHLTLQKQEDAISGAVGLDPLPGTFKTHLAPGERFVTPTVLIGTYAGGLDAAGNVLRPWVRRVLNNGRTWENPAYPMLVNNSWGSGMQVDEGLAMRMVRDSAELGLEMFHVDAGWFRGVGDWYPSPSKFPHGLAPIADAAHRSGVKFGIWVNWAQAGIDTQQGALNVFDPKVKDWLVADAPADWKPDEFVGRTIDLGSPAAKDYAQGEVDRIVTDYHLDMLEHDGYLVAKNCARPDHPHAESPKAMSSGKGSGIAMPDVSNSTDVSYHSVHAYYDIYSEIRRRHPGLLFEICNDGGRMVDFGSASHGDYFSITDSYDPLSNREAFYDASHVLPAAMLEDYVEKWPTPTLDQFRYMLRSGMMGWLTIMQDTNAWSAEQHAAAKAEFDLYKKELRPLIRDADLYHVSSRPDGVHWDGIEYFDAQRGSGVLYAFRGSGDEAQHAFLLRGLDPKTQYRLRFRDHASFDRTMKGSELLQEGINVQLPSALNSEIILLSAVK